jgi:hypothetical protein
VSHFTTLRTHITDRDALVAALADVGYDEVEVHDTPKTLEGWRGDRRSERAHVIVRRRHVGSSSNDIGFRRGDDGRFAAIISDHDRPAHDATWLNRVTARHAYHATTTTLAAQGYQMVEEQTEQGGAVRMVLRRVS